MGIFVSLFAGVVLLVRAVAAPRCHGQQDRSGIGRDLLRGRELMLGVGAGILAEETNALPTAQQAVGAQLVDSYGEHGLIDVLAHVGSVGLAVAIIGAAVTLRRTHRLGWAASS
jgi:hypothetical protein